MDYPLCDQTVTVYRLEENQVARCVLRGCYFQMQQLGKAPLERRFLLVVPGNTLQVFPGDRVLPGEGPQVAQQDWGRWIPALVPELVQVGWVKPCYFQGALCHTEAGN